MTENKYNTNEIQKLINNEKYNEASMMYIETIKDLKKSDSPLLAQIYNEYAYFLFSLQEYELSLLMFQNSYNLGYNKKETIDFIYSSFVIPNQDEFKKVYHTNIESNNRNIIYKDIPSFEELTIDFIPFAEDKYYIFDTETEQFSGIIDISNIGLSNYQKVNINDEFTDLIIAGDWNVQNFHDYILSAKDRILYYISTASAKSLSFLKLPKILENYLSNLVWVESLEQLQIYFHNNTSVYLPHQYFVPTEAYISLVDKMIREEHDYRLTPEGRNTDNIILTIGIPSYNRGHRALENLQHLINLLYDAEIELVVSNNCSNINTEGYDIIEKIEDSRVTYFKYPDKPGGNPNFCQVINMAQGKYCLLISDEDKINLPAIAHYLAVLKNNPNISFAKARGYMNYSNNTGKFFLMGKDAFLKSFLTTNYITGLIYRTDLYHKLGIYSWLFKLIETNMAVRHYIHTCWSIPFALYGDYYEDNTLLCIEGNPEKDVTYKNLNAEEGTEKIAFYSTVEVRIQQHYGFIEILNQFSDQIDKNTFLTAYEILCSKTYFLVSLVKRQYIDSGNNWASVCEKIKTCCIDGLSIINLSMTKDEKDYLLNYISIQNSYYVNIPS